MSKHLPKSNTVYDRMLGDILSLRLPPDAPLRLPALAKLYDIGMTPLRECLNRLTTEKFVIVEHNKGFRVAPLTYDELLDLERSRTDIEGSLFAEAVAQGDDTWEACVVGSFHHLSKSHTPDVLGPEHDLDIWRSRHAKFHAALISGAQSPWMHGFCAQLSLQIGRYQLFIQNALRDLSQTHPSKAREASELASVAMHLDAHRLLHDTALDRDADSARSDMRAHAALSLEAFTNLMTLVPEDSTLFYTLRPSPKGAAA